MAAWCESRLWRRVEVHVGAGRGGRVGRPSLLRDDEVWSVRRGLRVRLFFWVGRDPMCVNALEVSCKVLVSHGLREGVLSRKGRLSLGEERGGSANGVWGPPSIVPIRVKAAFKGFVTLPIGLLNLRHEGNAVGGRCGEPHVAGPSITLPSG